MFNKLKTSYRLHHTRFSERASSPANLYVGPQTIRSNNFLHGEIIMLVCWSACLVDLIIIWWYCKNQNNLKTQLKASPDYEKMHNQE
jgi:hypothetical protein